jgi:ClpP class serine protease
MTIHRNPLVFDAAMAAVWAMDEPALRALMEVAAREHEIKPAMLEAYRANDLERSERATFRGGVAIIDVAGPLFKRANLMTTFCGATAYEQVRRDLQAAMDNASVRAILLNIHSPGGEAAGVAELASAIHDIRGRKRIVSYAGDQIASAALWLGVASDEVYIGPTSNMGSLGVVAGYRDTSAQDAARGVKTYEFVSSQSPFKRVNLETQEGRDRVQARVDAMASVFVETVAKYRGKSVDHVLEHFGQGDTLIGQAAVNVGMADGIATFEQVLAKLSNGEDLKSTYGFNPTSTAAEGQTETETMKTEAELAAEAAAAAAATAPVVVTEASTETVDATAVAAARTEERKRVTDIMALTLPGYEKAASEAIEKGSSAHAFSAMIVAAEKTKRTERAEAIETDTEANAEVGPAPSKDQSAVSAEDAAVNSILGAFKLATGN